MTNDSKRDERQETKAAVTDLPAEQVADEQVTDEQANEVRGGFNFTKVVFQTTPG